MAASAAALAAPSSSFTGTGAEAVAAASFFTGAGAEAVAAALGSPFAALSSAVTAGKAEAEAGGEGEAGAAEAEAGAGAGYCKRNALLRIQANSAKLRAGRNSAVMPWRRQSCDHC